MRTEDFLNYQLNIYQWQPAFLPIGVQHGIAGQEGSPPPIYIYMELINQQSLSSHSVSVMCTSNQRFLHVPPMGTN